MLKELLIHYPSQRICFQYCVKLVPDCVLACDGDLEKVIQCIKIGVFVASTQEFTSQPAVANFASNLIANVFGDKGKHARFAVGSSSLPLNASVEIEAVFAIN